jgi:hypothetical protein
MKRMKGDPEYEELKMLMRARYERVYTTPIHVCDSAGQSFPNPDEFTIADFLTSPQLLDDLQPMRHAD